MHSTVSLVGIGTVGTAALRRLSMSSEHHVVSVIGRRADGQHLVDEVMASRHGLRSAPYFTSLSSALSQTRPEALIIATSTRIPDVAPLIIEGLSQGATVLCTSEELAFPDPDAADTQAIIAASAMADRGVVAVGVNPGFVFDSVPIWLSTVCGNPRTIIVRRIVDASVFGSRVRAGLGLDVTEEEFHAGVAAGTIRGHVGFPESARVIARFFDRGITHETEELNPVMAVDHDSRNGDENAMRTTCGVRQIARYWTSESPDPWLTFELDLRGNPLESAAGSRDEIVIDDGSTTVWTATPSAGAIAATSAQLVNLIRPALSMGAGLYTPVDVLGRCRGGIAT